LSERLGWGAKQPPNGGRAANLHVQRQQRLDFCAVGSVSAVTLVEGGMVGSAGLEEERRGGVTLRGALDRMEPDLRLLEGTVSVLRALSATDDAVEPIAIEALAYLAGETVSRIASRWREACGLLGEG
jgi:hypothetical protein